MLDRTVHAVTDSGVEVVRYGRAGKWRAEGPTGSMALSLRQAVDLACALSSRVNYGRPGGGAFDRQVHARR